MCVACRLLALPPVEVDAMGRPTWECSDADISKAYRRLSIFVHPDKPANQNRPEAREAFERLNEAHRILKDPAKRTDELNKRLEEAKSRRALAEAQATVSDRVILNAERTQAVGPPSAPSVHASFRQHGSCHIMLSVVDHLVQANSCCMYMTASSLVQAGELRKAEEAQLADKLRSQVQQRREAAQQKMKRRAQARPRQDSDEDVAPRNDTPGAAPLHVGLRSGPSSLLPSAFDTE